MQIKVMFYIFSLLERIEILNNKDFKDIRKKKQYAIVPIGSLEQHGDHLPFATDSIITEYLANKITERIPSIVLPTITYGISFEHLPFFNISLHHSTLLKILFDVCQSIIASTGINNIIIINGHHGNIGILNYLAQEVYFNISKTASINFINYWQTLSENFDHGGEIETSLVLAIRPDLVKMKNAKKSKNRLEKSKIAYQSLTNIPGSFPKITGNGIWGDPSNASKDKGTDLIQRILEKTVETINQFNIDKHNKISN